MSEHWLPRVMSKQQSQKPEPPLVLPLQVFRFFESFLSHFSAVDVGTHFPKVTFAAYVHGICLSYHA